VEEEVEMTKEGRTKGEKKKEVTIGIISVIMKEGIGTIIRNPIVLSRVDEMSLTRLQLQI